AIRRSDAAPAAATARAPTIRRLSGLNHTASALAVYASPHGSHRRTQDSLPLSANSTERDFNPQDSYERFPRRLLHRIPLSRTYLTQRRRRPATIAAAGSRASTAAGAGSRRAPPLSPPPGTGALVRLTFSSLNFGLAPGF